MNISRYRLCCAGLLVVSVFLVAASAMHAAPQAASFAGTWRMTIEGRNPADGGGGTGGGSGGREGGGGRGRGGAQTLTIEQDGEKFKVTHQTPRQEETFEAIVSETPSPGQKRARAAMATP
jgi:hypothetical protein